MIDLAIVIVNYKMREHVRECLASIHHDLQRTALQVRIVVVDNDSRDGIEGVIARSPLQHKITAVMLSENRGYGFGVNKGLQAVEARYYFVINPDITFFEQDTSERLVAFMDAHTQVGIAGPKLLNTDGTLQHSCWRFPRWYTPLVRRTFLGKTEWGQKEINRFLMKDFDHARTQPVDALMGSAMIVRGELLSNVGYMSDEYFMYFEDIDWCKTFWSHHKAVYYVHDIVLRHGWQRASAKIKGIKAFFLDKLTRTHVKSAIKYFMKWGI